MSISVPGKGLVRSACLNIWALLEFFIEPVWTSKQDPVYNYFNLLILFSPFVDDALRKRNIKRWVSPKESENKRILSQLAMVRWGK